MDKEVFEEIMRCEECGQMFPKSKLGRCHKCGKIMCKDCFDKHVCHKAKKITVSGKTNNIEAVNQKPIKTAYVDESLEKDSRYDEELRSQQPYRAQRNHDVKRSKFAIIGVVAVIIGIIVAILFGTGIISINSNTSVGSTSVGSIVGTWADYESTSSATLEIAKDLTGTLEYDFDMYTYPATADDVKKGLSGYLLLHKMNIKLTKTGDKTYEMMGSREYRFYSNGAIYDSGYLDEYVDMGTVTQISNNRIEFTVRGSHLDHPLTRVA